MGERGRVSNRVTEDQGKRGRTTDLSLGKTESTLIQVVSEQLHHSSLVRGESDDLTDQILGEGSALSDGLKRG